MVPVVHFSSLEPSPQGSYYEGSRCISVGLSHQILFYKLYLNTLSVVLSDPLAVFYSFSKLFY